MDESKTCDSCAYLVDLLVGGCQGCNEYLSNWRPMPEPQEGDSLFNVIYNDPDSPRELLRVDLGDEFVQYLIIPEIVKINLQTGEHELLSDDLNEGALKFWEAVSCMYGAAVEYHVPPIKPTCASCEFITPVSEGN